MSDSPLPVVLGLTGASGAAFAVRLLDVLLKSGREVHLTLSPSAVEVFRTELGIELNLQRVEIDQFLKVDESIIPADHPLHPRRLLSEAALSGRLLAYAPQDFAAGMASGSFRTAGMVVCPCSMGTLGAIAHGLSTNLLQRAADVHLKERRKLILVPRETPLGSIQLGNMKTLADAGAIILPAMPGYYHRPATMMELIDFVVQRICDQLGIDAKLGTRWGTDGE